MEQVQRRKHTTEQERIDFFLQLDRELRNHPDHRVRAYTEEEEDRVPWCDEAIRDIILNHPDNKKRL